MASIIDNKNKTMLESLKNSLKNAESVDILTAYFYFSGFDALAEELKDKKIRILVGKTIDPEAISELCRDIKNNSDEELDGYVKRGYKTLSNLQKRKVYIDSFIQLFNKSSLSSEFDDTNSQQVFKMFIDKLNDGSLEIRMTSESNHAKVFVLTNQYEHSCFGEEKGVVFMGSSNFTYNGLLGQGEVNERFDDNNKYDEYKNNFDQLWESSKSINVSIKENHQSFVNELKERLWIYATPSPYSIFIRILFEMYSAVSNCEVKTPSEITEGKFSNLKYQIDAIKYGVECINKNHGVIIADVVGLGKSVIASAIAHNLDVRKTIIIAPPHLKEQWEEYQQEFGIRGAQIWSSGKIEELHSRFAKDSSPILYVIDEAHRYRNELSESYQLLHQLTRSNSENKVILLTATPYNNRPQDLFALIKLFQTPSRSTINSVDNLGVRFHELIAKYSKLEKEGKKGLTDEIRSELVKLSQDLRMLIDPVIVRRSRIDLTEIKEYAEDLEYQGIKFPKVIGPELIEYDLAQIRGLYIKTLDNLSNKFLCARYNPSAYLIDASAFMKEYGVLFDETDIQHFQGNLAIFIRRLLIMRFESSKAAFKTTLDNILSSYENIKKWWAKGYVPIKKSGYLPDPDQEDIEETLSDIGDLNADEIVDINKIKKKAIPIPKELFSKDYFEAIDNDIELLQSIRNDWFESGETGFDPKYIELKNTIGKLLKENSKRKIVVFSFFADTACYVKDMLERDGFRVLLYTGGAKSSLRNMVKENFDASFDSDKQQNDYDIIVATDALSEGFNLNRAGVVFNYDIPYNPTRVVQRIGRINRINKKMFDEIFVYNFFPTDIGEENTLIKGISTLKMLLINHIVGSDTKTLTADETLESYFKKQYTDADEGSAEISWDNKYRNIYNSICHNTKLLDSVMNIPERARIVRKNNRNDCAISFAKRGNSALFAMAEEFEGKAKILSPEIVLPLFDAEISEKPYEFDSDLDSKFAVLRDEIQRPYPKIRLSGRKGTAIDNLEKLLVVCEKEKDYLKDLINVIKIYDDLSDGEVKYIYNLQVTAKKADEIVKDLKKSITEHYIMSIKEKVESIDSQTEIILFTEDLRSDID